MYEATFLFLQNEENFKEGLEKVKALLDKEGAKITKETDIGLRNLAYIIKKQTKAHYYYFELEIDPSKLQGLDRAFNILSPVLKYLFVKKDK